MGIHIVIAGESQCNVFAEICLVADYLSQNLPQFCYERIEKSVTEWKTWLFKINQKNKWHHIESPIVWKELLMIGSKPTYIGGAAEFLEYCHSYYKFDAFLSPKRFEHLINYFGQFQKKVKNEVQTEARSFDCDLDLNVERNNFIISIFAAGNPLTMFLISGLLEAYGKKHISRIYVYDEQCNHELMEFIETECNYIGTENSGKIVKYVDKIGMALTNADLLILLNYAPFWPPDTIGQWLHKNKKIMENMAIKINATASQGLLVVIPNVGPACYNATILANAVTRIKKNNIVVATSDIGLDMATVAAEIAEVPLRNMFCPPVWGFVGINHLADIRTTIHKYNTFDPNRRYIKVRNSTLCIGTLAPEMRLMEYLILFDDTLWRKVADRNSQKRKAERKISINKVVSVLNIIKIWLFDPNPNFIVNLGVQCDGNYAPYKVGSFGLHFKGVFSQPAQFVNKEWRPASHYMLPRDPQMKISYLEQIAEIVMKFQKDDLPQIVTYTPCICKPK